MNEVSAQYNGHTFIIRWEDGYLDNATVALEAWVKMGLLDWWAIAHMFHEMRTK